MAETFMLNIEEHKNYTIAIHHLGFRPFFLGAGVFSVLAVMVWFWLYHMDSKSLLPASLPVTSWHAHEMIFGYTFAVIAGFLLTAVRNWTNVQTIHGIPLILLVLLWLAARISPFLPFADTILVMALLDLGFNLFLLVSIAIPLLKTKQWGQTGILLIAMLLGLLNVIFYLGVFERFSGGIQTGISGGLYLCIFLVMLMGRRVIPFFIEKGVGEGVTVVNRKWLDIASIVMMIAFVVLEVFLQQAMLLSTCAIILFVLQVIRLTDWHIPGIWQRPLLWSLYVAYAFITLGFALKAVSTVFLMGSTLATHAFAYGGIGLMTLSMMSRVTLGHTGRNVFQPPGILQWIFLIFVSGGIVRVVVPMFSSEYYSIYIAVSQILWIIVFTVFILVFLPHLIRPRVDGRYG